MKSEAEKMLEQINVLAENLKLKEVEGYAGVVGMAASVCLASLCWQANVGELKLDLSNFTHTSKPDEISNWEIIVRKIEKST